MAILNYFTDSDYANFYNSTSFCQKKLKETGATSLGSRNKHFLKWNKKVYRALTFVFMDNIRIESVQSVRSRIPSIAAGMC